MVRKLAKILLSNILRPENFSNGRNNTLLIVV
uniref:Uncharacterized protein n=1 Tax=Arundo donax TaxID=35708 RepID=A0A0A9D8R4_ARUDO